MYQRDLVDNNIHEKDALWLTSKGDHEWEHRVAHLAKVC